MNISIASSLTNLLCDRFILINVELLKLWIHKLNY